MDSAVEGIKNFFIFNTAPTLVLAFGLLMGLGVLLSLGRRLDAALKLERLGIPIALLVGLIALLVGPFGPIPLLPQTVTDIWVHLPTALLTLVFATLMLGRPLPKADGLLQPVATQAFLGLFLGFGQYLVGGIVVLFVLIPLFGVNPLMGCLIEVGFEGGHGAAAIMGQSFSRLGFPGGLDLGLAIATVGLLISTILGSFLVVIGRWLGWLANSEFEVQIDSVQDEELETIWQQFFDLLTNLGLCGIAVLFGYVILQGLKSIAPFIGGIYQDVINVFPVFPLALLGSLLIRYILEKLGKESLSSQLLQREIGTLSTDLLITTAMASLNLTLLVEDWVPILLLSLVGLTWNLGGMFIFAKFVFDKEWFERSLIEFGNATGVAASGLLLLRLADPRNSTNTLPIFSIKQLLLQPLLSGGLVTVIAPLAITNLGLIRWTELSGIITFIFVCLGLLFGNKNNDLNNQKRIPSF